MKTIIYTPGGRLRPMLRLGLFIIFVILAGMAIGFVRRVTGLPQWTSNGIINPFPLLVIGLLVLGAVLGILALHLRWFEGRKLSTVGLPLSPPWEKGVLVGIVIGMLNISLYIFILLMSGNAEIALNEISVVDILMQMLPIFIGIAALSGWEEILLRGYSLQMLSEAFGYRMAAIITGLVFGFMHAGNPGANWQGLVYTALGGILMGWLVIRTGSLWMMWGYHASWNLTAGLLFGLEVSGISHPGSFLQTQIVGADWLTGGDYGFEGSVLVAAIEIIVLSVVLLFASRLPKHRELIGYFTGYVESEVEEAHADSD